MSIVSEKEVYAVATDPIYIGTGGYTIGRVDNTIIRDPIMKIPKIPGSSVAGTWRYYVALELQSAFKDKYKDKKERKKYIDQNTEKSSKDFLDEFIDPNSKNWTKCYEGNRFSGILCAGQDETPQINIEEAPFYVEDNKSGHCGQCIVCKAFGFSKKNESWQGMLFFSDLNILFFPVYTRLGVKWVTSREILRNAGLLKDISYQNRELGSVSVPEELEKGKESGYINLGWINLPYHKTNINIDLRIDGLMPEDIIIASESLISQIINSNLEVRTSVSINPITGAAKEKALFTPEAIPRGTIFYGKIRLFNKRGLKGKDLPSEECIWEALDDTKKYYEVLGIGGMVTRGFGRMKILSDLKNENSKAEKTFSGGKNSVSES